MTKYTITVDYEVLYVRKTYGNNILVRGWDDAKGGHFQEKVPFRPTMFLPSKNETGYKTLDGIDVAPVQPGTIKETRNFMEQYDGISGTKVYGMDRFLYHQYLAEDYAGDIEYDPED